MQNLQPIFGDKKSMGAEKKFCDARQLSFNAAPCHCTLVDILSALHSASLTAIAYA